MTTYNLSFDIILSGKYSQSDIKIGFDFNSTYISQIKGPHRSLINAAWLEAKKNNLNKGFNLYSGRLCRLLDVRKHSNTIELSLGKTTYKEYIGTRNPLLVKKYGIHKKQIANPLAICTVLLTADSKIIIIKRNPMFVDTMSNKYDVPGGFIQQPKKKAPNPFSEIKRELKEELDIISENIEKITCLGLIYDCELLHPELVMLTSLKKTSTELFEHTQCFSRKKGEVEELILVENTPYALYNFLEKNHHQFSPTGEANLFIYGSLYYGKEWQKKTSEIINSLFKQ